MRDFKDLTYDEVLAIDGDEASSAIEAVIITEINDGRLWNLFDRGGFSRSISATVGDVKIDFFVGLRAHWITEPLREEYGSARLEDMSDNDPDHVARLELQVAEGIVAEYLEKGLARRIWDDLCGTAELRAA
ncbi:MAG TPA: hypothetical protein VGO06_16030 [Bosea sp. (in: a-proteobacteria)]|jgi:hypothetical protein|uniref:hypothetical protein n=1 Tax=Bosea sp. (in: a-proteobacteria) TaxID=1871050 RepID=UPI002E15F96D|nr:hypothetical protein [Bosea sp. (in: a-proteobacteria)]